MKEIIVVKFYDCPYCNARNKHINDGFTDLRIRARETIFKCNTCGKEVKINSGWCDDLYMGSKK